MPDPFSRSWVDCFSMAWACLRYFTSSCVALLAIAAPFARWMAVSASPLARSLRSSRALGALLLVVIRARWRGDVLRLLVGPGRDALHGLRLVGRMPLLGRSRPVAVARSLVGGPGLDLVVLLLG